MVQDNSKWRCIQFQVYINVARVQSYCTAVAFVMYSKFENPCSGIYLLASFVPTQMTLFFLCLENSIRGDFTGKGGNSSSCRRTSVDSSAFFSRRENSV